MSPSEHHQAQLARVQHAVNVLIEHFGSVQVVASYQTEDGTGDTAAVFWGAGDTYARQGLCKAYLEQQERFADEVMFMVDFDEDEDEDDV